MDKHHNEEETGTVHVDITNEPALVNITHDAFNGFKRMVNMRRIVHGQNDASDDHCHQRQTCKRTKVPQVVQILWRWVFMQFMMHETKHRKTVVNPPNNWAFKILSLHWGISNQPILMTLSEMNA